MAEGFFKLDKEAKKNGADRYAGVIDGEELTIYIPQKIGRVDGRPAKALDITIKVV